MKIKNVSIFILVILAGAVMGNFLGKLITMIFPQGAINDLFSTNLSMGFDPVNLDLIIAALTFGLKIHLNVTGIIGIVLTAVLARKLLK